MYRLKLLIFCLLIAINAALPSAGLAATYYVDATSGNDSNIGTESQPWKTLTKAANTAVAGDTVLVKAGIYNETLRPANSGVPGAMITFKAYPGEECQGSYGGTKSNCQVIIDGQNTLTAGVDLSYGGGRKYIRIEGFEIRNFNNGFFLQAWGDTGVWGIEIVNNYIYDNAKDAIYAKNSLDCLFENNEIYANGDTALEIGGRYGSDGAIVRGNNIHYNGKDGIRGGCVNGLIEENRIYNMFHTDKHQDGLDLSGTQRNMIIRNNLIYDLTQLIYFPLNDEPGDYIENIQIYGNILYTDKYWTTNGSEAPGIFIDASRDDSIVRNIYIHSNTFGWVGYGAVWIYGNPATVIDGITLRNNICYDSGIDISTAATNVDSDYNLFF